MFLEYNGQGIQATDEELEAITMSVAEGKLAVEALAIWIRQRLTELPP